MRLASGWLARQFPGVDFLGRHSGHLLEGNFGWRSNPYFGPFHLLDGLLHGVVAGFVGRGVGRVIGYQSVTHNRGRLNERIGAKPEVRVAARVNVAHRTVDGVYRLFENRDSAARFTETFSAGLHCSVARAR